MSTNYQHLLATALASMFLAGMTSAHAAEPVPAPADRATRSPKALADEQLEVMFLEVRAKKAKLLADIRKAETDGAQVPTLAAGIPAREYRHRVRFLWARALLRAQSAHRRLRPRRVVATGRL